MPPNTTLRDDVQGHVDISYPPQGPSAVQMFLAGSPTAAAFEAKLAYMQYGLLDLGMSSVCDALRCGCVPISLPMLTDCVLGLHQWAGCNSPFR